MGSSGNLSALCMIVIKGIKYSYINRMEKEFLVSRYEMKV